MQSQSNESFRRRSGRLVKHRIAAFSAAIMAAICLLVAEAVLREREAAFEQARAEATNLSAGFEEQVRGTLNGIAGAMEFLKARVEAEGPAFDLHRWRERVPELVSPAVHIMILDASGRVRASTLKRDTSPVYLLERDYFLAHRNNPNLGFFVGRPIFGKVSKRLIIPVTRRLNSPDGQFAGVLNFGLDPERLTTLYRKVNLGQTASMELIHRDGTIMARYTQANGLDTSSIGKKAANFDPIMDGNLAGTGEFSGKSSVDGVSRLYHWRDVQGYPLLVATGLSKSGVLADANYQARIVIGLGIAALSLPLIMMFMLNREISQRVEHSVALDRESEKVRDEHRALLAITEELAKERMKLRKTNSELVLARRRAESSSQAKSAFLANMSHELRTPLNAILGFSEIIRDRIFGDDAGRYADYAADIHRSGSHLLNIVSDILDITRIEAGKLEVREEKVKLGVILTESLRAVTQQAVQAGVLLASTVPDAGALILGDKTKLIQIVINLLSNAIKFTPEGGSVTLSAAKLEDGGLNVMIRDTGIGMSNHEIRDALELFRQVDNSLGRRYEGTGLGLPLALKLMELHGGSLTIDSVPRHGTVVTLHFPSERIAWDVSYTALPATAGTVPLKIAS
jgi:signal transduction histidine kinase